MPLLLLIKHHPGKTPASLADNSSLEVQTDEASVFCWMCKKLAPERKTSRMELHEKEILLLRKNKKKDRTKKKV